jgi:hypothetical protein
MEIGILLLFSQNMLLALDRKLDLSSPHHASSADI